MIIRLQAKQKGVSSQKRIRIAVDSHFADVMADYYAKGNQCCCCRKKVKPVTLKPPNRKVEEKPEEVQASKTETEQEKYNRTFKKVRTGLLLA